MNAAPRIIRWQEGRVDRTKEHFELRYGSLKDSDWGEWSPVAVVGAEGAGAGVDVRMGKLSDAKSRKGGQFGPASGDDGVATRLD